MEVWTGAYRANGGLTGGSFKDWGANDYVLAWEDLAYAESDKDFQDFVLLLQNGKDSLLPNPDPAFSGATPVLPEASTWLAGIGAVGMLLVAVRRKGGAGG